MAEFIELFKGPPESKATGSCAGVDERVVALESYVNDAKCMQTQTAEARLRASLRRDPHRRSVEQAGTVQVQTVHLGCNPHVITEEHDWDEWHQIDGAFLRITIRSASCPRIGACTSLIDGVIE